MQVASLIPTPPGVAVAEDAEDHLAHRRGRVAAVLQQVVVGLPARAALVHAVRLDQAQEGVEGQAAAGDRLGQGGEAGIGRAPARDGRAEVGLPGVEPGEPLGGAAGALVAQVVGRPAEGVDRAHVGAHVARGEQEGHREVLVVRPGRGARGRPALRGDRAHRSALPSAVTGNTWR